MTTLGEVITHTLTAIGGVGIGQVGGVIRERLRARSSDKRAAARAAGDEAKAEAEKHRADREHDAAVAPRLFERIAKVEADQETMRAELKACEEKHADCVRSSTAKVEAARAELDAKNNATLEILREVTEELRRVALKTARVRGDDTQVHERLDRLRERASSQPEMAAVTETGETRREIPPPAKREPDR